MKRAEFKELIKPIVHECIKESLLEEGLISNVIAEVAKGMSVVQPLTETKQETIKQEPKPRSSFNQEMPNKLHEHKQKLMSAIGPTSYNGVNLFEGTTPAPAQASPSQQSSPLSGQGAADPGVDISNLIGGVSNNWSAHMNNIKKESR